MNANERRDGCCYPVLCQLLHSCLSYDWKSVQSTCCLPTHLPICLVVIETLQQYKVDECIAGVTALSLLITPFLMQASNRWLLLADPEAGTLVSLLQQPCWASPSP